jgi:acetyl esterase
VSSIRVYDYNWLHDFEVDIYFVSGIGPRVTTPQGLDRLDPELVASGALLFSVLGPDTLPVSRESLNSRRATLVVDMPTDGVEFQASSVTVDDRSIPLRVYRGTNERPAPTLFFFHSGGLVLGNLDTDHRMCVALAGGAHCVVVSVDYRIAPEHPYPAAIDDCFDAVRGWVVDAAANGTDVARLAIGGNSAGAGLTAAVALRLRDEGGPSVRLQLMHQPMLDASCSTPSMVEFVQTPGFNSQSAKWSWASYLAGQPATPYASPSTATSLEGLAPAYICCSELDPLRDEAIDYAHRLVQAGVPTELHLVPRTCHGFGTIVPAHPVSVAQQAVEIAALVRAWR